MEQSAFGATRQNNRLIELLRFARLAVEQRHFTEGHIKHDADDLMARIPRNACLPTGHDNEPMAGQATNADAFGIGAKRRHARRIEG